MVKTAIYQRNNTEAVDLPPGFCKELGLNIGDQVQITIENNRIIIEPFIGPYTFENLMKGWKGGRYHSPEIDWGPPVGKEIW